MPASVGDVNVSLSNNVTRITAGFGHTCALLDNGKVRCWGLGIMANSVMKIPTTSETTSCRPALAMCSYHRQIALFALLPVTDARVRFWTVAEFVAGASDRAGGLDMEIRTTLEIARCLLALVM
jgi:hypothetical protein